MSGLPSWVRSLARLALGLGHRAWWLVRWCARHRRWLAAWVILAALVWLSGDTASAVLLLAYGLAPGLVGMVWDGLAPWSYERLVAGPSRRLGWWWFARTRWQHIAQSCHLTARETHTAHRVGRRVTGHVVMVPWLRRVRPRGHVLELTIRARPGQTLDELVAGAERIATTFAALSHRAYPKPGASSGCTVVVELVMRDLLTYPVTAHPPGRELAYAAVRIGRTQAGRSWYLPLLGRHTLVAGCSGAGKASVMWGICCGLAPAVHADLVRLWGIDLKRGVELATGAGLFSAHAYTPTAAVTVLRELMGVIDARGASMVGHTRLHNARPGDPLHVLVVDELAALTAYAELNVRREANRLLAEVLTQGRALGVVVVACVQDPRKDVVAMRGLFTQTVALRLRSPVETMMVLGDGMTHDSPAHRISPARPGTGWVVDDAGAADRGRADYWPDQLIRATAATYPTSIRHHPHLDPAPGPAMDAEDTMPLTAVLTDDTAVPRPRAPRKPRRPRAARVSGGDAEPEGGAA